MLTHPEQSTQAWNARYAIYLSSFQGIHAIVCLRGVGGRCSTLTTGLSHWLEHRLPDWRAWMDPSSMPTYEQGVVFQLPTVNRGAVCAT